MPTDRVAHFPSHVSPVTIDVLTAMSRSYFRGAEQHLKVAMGDKGEIRVTIPLRQTKTNPSQPDRVIDLELDKDTFVVRTKPDADEFTLAVADGLYGVAVKQWKLETGEGRSKKVASDVMLALFPDQSP